MNAANDTRLLPGDVGILRLFTMLRPVPRRMSLRSRHALPELFPGDIVLVVHVPVAAGSSFVEHEPSLFSLVITGKGIGYVYTENIRNVQAGGALTDASTAEAPRP